MSSDMVGEPWRGTEATNEAYFGPLLEPIVHELDIQAEHPLADDEVMAAFYRTYRRNLTVSDEARSLTEQLVTNRPELTPNNVCNLLLRSFQCELMDRPDYPRGFTTDGAWIPAIDTIIKDPSPRERLDQNLDRQIQSNIADRYISLNLIMKWLEQNGRLSKFPLVLDVGCSQNHGLIKLASDSVWRRPLFRPIAATRPLSSESVGAAAIEPDALATHRLNALLGSSLTFGYGIGVDIAPMHHPDVKKWARSNSFYPKELLDIDRVEEYDTLDTIRPQNVSFMELDFLKPEQAPYLHNPSDDWHGFQVVMMSTVLHQLSAEDRVTMLDVAKRCVRPDGIIVVQDFAHLDPADPSQLVFYERWNDEPYRYRTFIIDMQDPGQLQEVFVWDSGRCRALQIGLGRLATGGGRTNSFHDILGVVRDEVA